MRTVFIGGTQRGYLTLKALIGMKADLVGVISMEQDSHETVRFENQIQEAAETNKVPFHQTRHLSDAKWVELLKDKLKPDLGIVVGCRVMIPRDLYEVPPRGTVAVHDSLLPEYRGFAPLTWAIINGQKETGVTLFYLDERMDGGDIVSQKRVPLGPNETGGEIYEKVCQATVDVVCEQYPLLEKGKEERKKQDYSSGSFCCSRTPEDGRIDWATSGEKVYNLIRAITDPYPGAYSYYEGKKLVIWKAKPVEPSPQYAGRIPGKVVRLSKKDGSVDVLTGDSVIRLFEVQFEGEERLPASSILKSVKRKIG